MLNQEDRRAQIGETLTWLVATIIIVIILFISIFVAIPLGNSNKFDYNRKNDLLATKSLISYLISDKLYNELKEGGKLNENDEKMIEELYENDYAVADLGLVPKDSVISDVVDDYERSIEIVIELNDKKDVSLSLREKKK